jgi:hypothetical protein
MYIDETSVNKVMVRLATVLDNNDRQTHSVEAEEMNIEKELLKYINYLQEKACKSSNRIAHLKLYFYDDQLSGNPNELDMRKKDRGKTLTTWML